MNGNENRNRNSNSMINLMASGYLAQVYTDIISGIVPVINGDPEEQYDQAFESIARMCGDYIASDVAKGNLSLPDSIKVSAEIGRILCEGKEVH